MVIKLCEELNSLIPKVSNSGKALELSYSVHFHLVSIHPFYDGNGRTSRLLMNLIQQYFKVPLSTVYKEDKLEYYQSLTEARQTEQLLPIIEFMTKQHIKFLNEQMKPFLDSKSKNFGSKGFSFLL
jgi:Fic family protein